MIGLEHRSEICGRARDDMQDLSRCRLLFQGLGEVAVACLEFLEQPDVLNGDGGLVGEGLQKGDLPLREEADFRARKLDRPDRDALAHQWNAEHRVEP